MELHVLFALKGSIVRMASEKYNAHVLPVVIVQMLVWNSLIGVEVLVRLPIGILHNAEHVAVAQNPAELIITNVDLILIVLVRNNNYTIV